METLGRKSRKASRHRKRHIPVGPAGVWFQSQKQQKRLGGEQLLYKSRDATVGEECEEEDMEDENPREKHLNQSKPSSSTTAPCFGSHPAWMLMQCALGFCTPALLSTSLTSWERYQLLRPHVPHQYVMLPEIMYDSSNNNNSNNAEDNTTLGQRRKCHFMKLPSHEKLLVLLQSVQSYNSNDHSGWTLTLQDETGCTIQAWIQPALVRQEWEQPTGPQYLRVGNVLLLQHVSFMLQQQQSSQNQHHDDRLALDDFNQNEPQTSKKLQRMLLVSKANIARVWTTKEAEKTEHDQIYLEWTEKRNSFPSSSLVAIQQPQNHPSTTTDNNETPGQQGLQHSSTSTSSQQISANDSTDHETTVMEQGLTPTTFDTQDLTSQQQQEQELVDRRATSQCSLSTQPSQQRLSSQGTRQEVPMQLGEPLIRSLHTNRMSSATNTSTHPTLALHANNDNSTLLQEDSDQSKKISVDASVSIQHEMPQQSSSLLSTKHPMSSSSILHSTDHCQEEALNTRSYTREPSSTPAVSIDWFSSTSNAAIPRENEEWTQSIQSDRQENEQPMTLATLGSQQPLSLRRTMTTATRAQDQPTRHSSRNAATGFVTPASRNSVPNSSWQQHSQPHTSTTTTTTVAKAPIVRTRNPYQRKNIRDGSSQEQQQDRVAMTPLATSNSCTTRITPMTFQKQQQSSVNKTQQQHLQDNSPPTQEPQNGIAEEVVRVACQDVTHQVVRGNHPVDVNKTKQGGPAVVAPSKNTFSASTARKEDTKVYSTAPVSTTLWTSSSSTPSMMNLNLPSSDDEEDDHLSSPNKNKTSILGHDDDESQQTKPFVRTSVTTATTIQHEAQNKQSTSTASLLFQASSFATHNNFLPSSSDEDD